MKNTLAIASRELTSFFYSPIAYVVTCLFMLLAGFFFLTVTFQPDQPAELRRLFTVIVWILIAVVPAISMRLMSEELRSGTIEPLMTSPVSDLQVIAGKWLGSLAFFILMLAPTIAYVIIIEIHADPDYGPILSGYTGLILVGGLYLAIGSFASSLTRNQIIAFILTVFTILIFTIAAALAPRFLPNSLAPVASYLNVNRQYDDFSKGLIDISNIVFFLSAIAFFLTLAVKALESRKWR